MQPIKRVAFHVAIVQPERELVDVAAKVFRAGVMINAVKPTLQNGENAFHAVRRHVIADVFSRTVIDGVVLETGSADAMIDAALIGMQGCACLNVLMKTRPCAGLDLQPQQLGARGTELLIAQLQRNETGIPEWPTTTTIPARGIDGPTLRSAPPSK